MRVLVDIGHPAHIHLFKNMIHILEEKGHEVKITTRDKDVTLQLLRAYGFGFECFGKHKSGMTRKAVGMLEIDLWLYKITRKFGADVLIGVHNPYTAHVATLLRKRSITFTDTEHVRLASYLTFPFTKIICTPECFLSDLGKKQVRYKGLHELAYLHPKYFKPDPLVLRDIGLSPQDRFFVLRFVSWKASHDVGQMGYSLKARETLVKSLEEHGTVLISAEGKLTDKLRGMQVKIRPEKLHDLLYYATLYLGEGATMATEAGVLGTPSIYVSSLVGTMGNFETLEKKYELVYSFDDPEKGDEKAMELILKDGIKEEWKRKKDRLLEDMIDVSEFMVNLVEKQENER